MKKKEKKTDKKGSYDSRGKCERNFIRSIHVCMCVCTRDCTKGHKWVAWSKIREKEERKKKRRKKEMRGRWSLFEQTDGSRYWRQCYFGSLSGESTIQFPAISSACAPFHKGPPYQTAGSMCWKPSLERFRFKYAPYSCNPFVPWCSRGHNFSIRTTIKRGS